MAHALRLSDVGYKNDKDSSLEYCAELSVFASEKRNVSRQLGTQQSARTGILQCLRKSGNELKNYEYFSATMVFHLFNVSLSLHTQRIVWSRNKLYKKVALTESFLGWFS